MKSSHLVSMTRPIPGQYPDVKVTRGTDTWVVDFLTCAVCSRPYPTSQVAMRPLEWSASGQGQGQWPP